MFHTLAWVSEILEFKNSKGSIGKRIFRCSQRSTEIALLLTNWPLTTCSWARILRQRLRLAWRGARHWCFMIKLRTLLRETFTWIYRKYANSNNNSSIFRVFVFFSRKSSGKQIVVVYWQFHSKLVLYQPEYMTQTIYVYHLLTMGVAWGFEGVHMDGQRLDLRIRKVLQSRGICSSGMLYPVFSTGY